METNIREQKLLDAYLEYIRTEPLGVASEHPYAIGRVTIKTEQVQGYTNSYLRDLLRVFENIPVHTTREMGQFVRYVVRALEYLGEGYIPRDGSIVPLANLKLYFSSMLNGQKFGVFYVLSDLHKRRQSATPKTEVDPIEETKTIERQAREAETLAEKVEEELGSWVPKFRKGQFVRITQANVNAYTGKIGVIELVEKIGYTLSFDFTPRLVRFSEEGLETAN